MRIQNQYTKNICKSVDRFGDYGCYNVCCSFRTSPSDRIRVIPTVLAIIVAVIVYGVLILKLGALSEKDIQALPMGTRILRGCQALKLMLKRRIKISE